MLLDIQDFTEKEDKILNRSLTALLATRRLNGFKVDEYIIAKADTILCDILYNLGEAAVKQYVASYMSNPVDKLRSAA